jgi:hypothetical protein
MAWLTAGWVRCSFDAAREKLRSAATVRNTRNSARSKPGKYKRLL